MKSLLFLLPFAAALTASAALPAVGPNYVRPAAPVPGSYRDVDTSFAWKAGTPADALSHGSWWRLFRDPVLDGLENRALAANQDLRGAAARVEEARAEAGLARSDYWPRIAANGEFTRERTSSTTANVFPATLTNTYNAPLSATWELDVFGRVRRLSESARADAAASAATFEAVRLAMTADVASTYFTLGALDRELAIVRETAELRRRALQIENVRLRHGTAAEVDVARAETELATADADAADLENRRASVRNALAVLIGAPASDFQVTPSPVGRITAPVVPPGLPADLLERRPDIAAAERSLAAANARIGVAKAAFFPAISLTGSAGFASDEVDTLFNADSRVWSIGPRLYLPIFQGGRNRANLERSRAAFDEAVAIYRGRVLVAFRDVQDALTSGRWIAAQLAAQQRALTAAKRAEKLTQSRYDAGYVSYFEVIDAQRTSLAVERAAVRLEAQRLNASVALIKSLGGGWTSTALVAAR
ncbi:MAG TPA: efflux transporter outer membrane subunit [Opitutaceae bacterium]|nr:efflux transporter outer membrane subunit [Opitutaceae bacterium]